MKDFFKMTLAVICGILLAGFLFLFLTFGLVGSLSSSGTKPVLPKSGVLTMDMSKFVLSEQTQETDPMSAIQGNATKTVGLLDAVQAIDAAAADPSVKFIFLKPDGVTAGMTQLEELRKSFESFRQSGKAIVSYIENPSTASYYLASASDKILMTSNVGAGSQITGVGTQMIFLKDLLDKLGVNIQLIRHGKYKSAGEMYIKNAPSPENLEQTQVMISSIWDTFCGEIAQSRAIAPEKFSALIDDLALNFPEDFLANGLVDELVTKEELKEKLTVLFGAEKYDEVKSVALPDYIAAKVLPNFKAKKKIAIIYAEGNIVEGSQKSQIAGDRYASIISKVRADSTIKAVVLRVASPGGSVLASDKIKTEIDLLRKVKPVIASYGDYAASGGYWISNSCDKIFTGKTTLTGSIGVFGMIPDLSKTAKDLLHINITTVGSNKHSTMPSLTRPMDESETAYMQASIEHIYDAFVNTVAEGRDLTPAFVDSIAQGRVWTGADALEIGLVDEIGTLKDALHYAAICAGTPDGNLDEWRIENYPKPKTTLETLMETLGQTSEEAALDQFPGMKGIRDSFRNWDFRTSDKVYARMPFEYVIQL